VAWISFAYIAAVLATAIPSLWNGNYEAGFAGLFAPLISTVAAAGALDGYRDKESPTLPVLILGSAFLGVAIYWVWATGWSVQLFGQHVSGVVWCLIGAAVGLLFRLTYRSNSAVLEQSRP
jgi:hypothetical protein